MNAIEGLSTRLNYQRMFSEGSIVNIGCGEDPALFGEAAVHVDMDVYNHKNFVMADAHNLPFSDGQFDTAVLGDMLEHCPDPVKVMSEAGRVAKKVVLTVYEEWRLKETGQTVEDYIKHFEESSRKLGFKTHMEYLKSLPVHSKCIVSVTPDDEVPHHPHIHEFTDQSLRKVVSDAGLTADIFTKFQEGVCDGRPVYNWLIVAHK